MFGIGMGELIVIVIIALLFVGPEKLPEAAKTLSKGIRDFRRQSRELQKTIEDDEDIGGAIRDLKSALRGDDIYTPPRAREARPAAGALAKPAAAAAAVEAPTREELPESPDTEPAADVEARSQASQAVSEDSLPVIRTPPGIVATRRAAPPPPAGEDAHSDQPKKTPGDPDEAHG